MTDKAKSFEEALLAINAAALSRLSLSRHLTDPRRDYEAECGYPVEPSAEDFQRLYDRDPIAARVNDVMVEEMWQVGYEVYESEDNVVTEFESRVDRISEHLYGQESWLDDEGGSPVIEYLKRLDKMSGIGKYGIMVMGFDDGKPWNEPLLRGAATKLLSCRVFPESQAKIAVLDSNPISRRYGHPVKYNVLFNEAQLQYPVSGLNLTTHEVHWTRVHHLADGLRSSDVIGVERMRPVLNRLLDLYKLYGSSAEMFWKGAFHGISLETHPALGGDVAVDTAAIKDMMENYENGLQRWLSLMGMTAKTLAPTISDPTSQINAHIDAICIKLGVPRRVFIGSERGELASTQDDDAWNDRLRQRMRTHGTPRVVAPFYNKLIWAGVLPPPVRKFKVYWADLTSRSDADKATVGSTRTSALAQYMGSGAMEVVTPFDWLTKFMLFSDDDANAVLTAATREVVKSEEGAVSRPSPLAGLVGGISAMLEIFQKYKDGTISEQSAKQLIMYFFNTDEAKAAEMLAADSLPTGEVPLG